FESPGEQQMEPGVLSGFVGYLSILEYTARNQGKVMDLVHSARFGTVAKGENPGDPLTVQQEYGPADFQVTYDITENRRDPESCRSGGALRYRDQFRPDISGPARYRAGPGDGR
ncbi:hypothetical protein ACFL41_02720, partial [Gemmatimonadota bacterium]